MKYWKTPVQMAHLPPHLERQGSPHRRIPTAGSQSWEFQVFLRGATCPSILPSILCWCFPFSYPVSPKSAIMAPALGVFDDSLAENRTAGALGKTTSGKRLKIRAYPKFDSLEEERVYRKQHLAAAFRVFADRGFDEGVAGHISVRDPILTDHFCMSPRFLQVDG